ncbi:MAG: YgaC family protein [Microbacterium sp.]|nr:YgaC family protein [Microbacterium sp.]
MSAQRPEPGQTMIFQWRKWDGSEHWGGEGVYLGADQWGDWIGQPVGWASSRPGRSFVAESPNVTLVPRDAADYALTVHRGHPRAMRIYIDLAWDVRWSDDDPLLATAIDMDLDVVRHLDERGTRTVDQDEWEEHSAQFAYPADVVTHLEARAAELETQVRAQQAPFDDATADAWIDRLVALGLDRPLA